MLAVMEELKSGAPPRSASEDILHRAREMVPDLISREIAATQVRDVPTQTIEDFERAGLLRLLRPRMFGGAEADPTLMSQVVQELAMGCASSAWVYGVLAEHAGLISAFPEQAQIDVWGDSPLTRASSSLAPRARAVSVDGGYRLSGQWPFSSGSAHAAWVIVGAFVDYQGASHTRYFLAPMGDINILDDWQTIGLRATGSRTLEFIEVFVPEHRTVDLADLANGSSPGRRLHPDFGLLGAPRGAFSPFSQAPVALSLGRRALDVVTKSLTGPDGKLPSKAARSESLQCKLAESASELDAATSVLDHARQRSAARLASGEPFQVTDVLITRRDVTFVQKLVKSAVERLCQLSGTSWVYSRAPLGMIYADLLATSAHFTANLEGNMVPWARDHLGMDPQNRFG